MTESGKIRGESMRRLFLLILIIIQLNISSQAHSKETQEFIDNLANKIYEDCKDTTIALNTTSFTFEGKHLDSINPDLQSIKSVLGAFSNAEPYNISAGGVTSGSTNRKGKEVLTCGTHKLDINGYNYFWDNMRIEVPKQQINTQNIGAGGNGTINGDIVDSSNYSKTTGDNSPAISGKNNRNSQNNFFMRFITIINNKITLTLGLALSLSLLWNLSTARKIRKLKKTPPNSK